MSKILANRNKTGMWLKYLAYKSSTVIILIIVLIFFQITNLMNGNNFLTISNISTVFNQATFLTLAGLAQLMVVLTGGINLAIGSIMVLTAIIAGYTLTEVAGVFFLIPIVIMLIFGTLIGWSIGLIVTKIKIPPFIATFAVMYVFRGIAWIIMGRQVWYGINPTIRFLAGGIIFSIGDFAFTMPMAIVLIILVILGFLLQKTSYGRRLYFTGSKQEAARFSGINTTKIIVVTYMISGLLCGICAAMYTGRLNAVEPSMYASTHFDAVSVVLIGGASMSGGVGSVWSTAVGAIIISFIQSGMNSIQVPSEFQTLVLGVLIIISVYTNQNLQKQKNIIENEVKE